MIRLFRVIVPALAFALTPSFGLAQSPSWTLDPETSRLTFAGTQMGGRFEGHFREYAADIRFDPDAPDAGRVEVTIRMASVDSGGGDRDRTVVGEDFFHVTEYPTATFTVESFTPTTDGAYTAVGSLTMKGVTQSVELPVTIAFSGEAGSRSASAAGELTVSRLDFNIGEGQWTDLSVVGEMVTIRFDITAMEAP